MKKIISVFLAIIMVFSMATIAFAADEAPETGASESSEETTTGEFNIEDIPLWQVKLGLKLGKIIGKPVLKIALALLKVAMSLGLVDAGDLIQGIIDMITNISGGDGAEEPSPETPATPATPEVE